MRDFLSNLPLEVTVEDFQGSEKFAYLPTKLAHEGSQADPEDGDLIYYTP